MGNIEHIENFKLVWNNLGLFKIGKSVIKMEVCIKNCMDQISLAVDNGIQKQEYTLDADSSKILKKIENLNLPTQNYSNDETTTNDFEMYINDLEMNCYLRSSKFLDEIKNIIGFDKILDIAKSKANND